MEKQPKVASVHETLSFVFDCGKGLIGLFLLGVAASIANGLVQPALAFITARSFNRLANAANNGIGPVRETAIWYMILGVYALFMSTIQTGCFEAIAYRASHRFRVEWFSALLRQDAAFFDVYDVGGIASTIGPTSDSYRRGIAKIGRGIEYSTTAIAGIALAFTMNWRSASVILGALPILSLAGVALAHLNQRLMSRASEAYNEAGSVAYTTVSSIRTVLSLNAVPKMIDMYTLATSKAYSDTVPYFWLQGLAYATPIATFLLVNCILTLYGMFLIARDVQDTGCDPSGGVIGNTTCQQNGASLFGTMIGIIFAAKAVSQMGPTIELFAGAQAATSSALLAIQRKPGAPQEFIYTDSDDVEEEPDDGVANKNVVSRREPTTDTVIEDSLRKRVKAILPEYLIDASSEQGLKPQNVNGQLTFHDIEFSYPTRPNKVVLKDFSLDIPAGTTVALVGPSGGGKSTTVALLERFYDPLKGTVLLDGVDLKDINVTHLRRMIGYVGQEPTLFPTSIAENIKCGNPNATQEQVEEAARMANAHGFVQSFPDGYNTQVGDKGTQLSGGQKQRIAIARVLVGNPSILVLDEATSALDSESEYIVQQALDNVLAERKRTTIIIAHRLSTVRNADLIAVVSKGRVVELGTHDTLMLSDTGHYRNLVEKQEGITSNPLSVSREQSSDDLTHPCEECRPPISSHSIHFNFMDIVFAYPTRPSRLVFKGFNLSILEGETIALVGPSGGGKSTIVSLIERFYDPNEGEVEYLENNIKSLNLKWYRDQIGFVGQEPILFNDTIANNIAYGAPQATMDDIIEAAQQANAHDFVMSFPDGYNTIVGTRGSQLSGGQKQRVAIARALVKKPKVLLLDEATSALDTDSEAVVQEALDKIMASRSRTTIVIAHRLSTIRYVDRIAFIEDGRVKELGTHDELMSIPKGRFKRLVDVQRRASLSGRESLRSRRSTVGRASLLVQRNHDDGEEHDWNAEVEEEESKQFSFMRARKMAAPDSGYLAIGSIGAIVAGVLYPMWGILFANMTLILYQPVFPCNGNAAPKGTSYGSCDEYIDSTTSYLRHRSYIIGSFWVVLAFQALVGFVVTYWAFGVASARLSKRIRDKTFSAVVRQEVSFFDKRNASTLTTQLQEDASRINAFTGEPIRSLVIALSSLLTGIVIALFFMWPVALMGLATLPFFFIAANLETRQLADDDVGTVEDKEKLNSPNGVALETILNIRTVASLTLENRRFDEYKIALHRSEPRYIIPSLLVGIGSGLFKFVEQFATALLIWWGGYNLFNHENLYSFKDFLTAILAWFFSLFVLDAALAGVSDRKEVEKSASRVFYMLDRQSEIDPLGKLPGSLQHRSTVSE